jgi:hypothetical protein
VAAVQSVNEYVSQIESELGASWLPAIYRDRILRMRTRAYQFPATTAAAKPEIHHTLLGIELKMGRRRVLCPDLATARYLLVFARLGARDVAIPYDITTISLAADELDSSWHRMLLLAESVTADRSAAFRTRVRRQLIGKVQAEIATAGPGPRIPEFKQSTRLRNRER